MQSPSLSPLYEDRWSTEPSCNDGCTEHMACKTCSNYRVVVMALPREQRAPFVCPCCPESPGVALVATALLPIPQTYCIFGAWRVACKLQALELLIKPPLAPSSSVCDFAAPILHDALILRMKNEVEARVARGLPGTPTATLLKSPAGELMVK
jgi:hypothetical protein